MATTPEDRYPSGRALAEDAELTRSKAAVQDRYDLTVDAIKMFHTSVCEDFLLKQDQFKELRDRLLKSAADFYGKLEALLGKETDVASRRSLAQANLEVADLTAKVGRPEDALTAHRAVLARRRDWMGPPTLRYQGKVDGTFRHPILDPVPNAVDIAPGNRHDGLLGYQLANPLDDFRVSRGLFASKGL